MSTQKLSRIQVLDGIREVVREHLVLADPSLLQRSVDDLEDLRLIEDLGLDSIALLTLAVEVENHFQVALDEFGSDQEEDEDMDGAEGTGSTGSTKGVTSVRATEEISRQAHGATGAPEAPGPIATLGDLVALIHQKLAMHADGATGPTSATGTAD